jgi:hypothetical protein
MTSTGGEKIPEGIDPKSVMVERSVPKGAMEDALLAWEMIGAPIPHAHGGPLHQRARLFRREQRQIHQAPRLYRGAVGCGHPEDRLPYLAARAKGRSQPAIHVGNERQVCACSV